MKRHRWITDGTWIAYALSITDRPIAPPQSLQPRGRRVQFGVAQDSNTPVSPNSRTRAMATPYSRLLTTLVPCAVSNCCTQLPKP